MPYTQRQLAWAKENGVSAQEAPLAKRHAFASPDIEVAYEGLDPSFRQIVEEAPKGVITSAFRDPERNAMVGGVPNSLHPKGRAVDFRLDDLTPQRAEYFKSKGLQPLRESDHLHTEADGDLPAPPSILTERQKKWAMDNGVAYPGMEVPKPEVPLTKKMGKFFSGLNTPSAAEVYAPEAGMNADKAFSALYSQPEGTASTTPLLNKKASDVAAGVLSKSVFPINNIIDLIQGNEESDLQKGVKQSLSDTIQGMSTPESLVTVGSLAKAPLLLAPMLPGMAKDTYEGAEKGIQSLRKGDIQGAAKSGTDALTSLIMTLGGAAGLKSGLKSLKKAPVLAPEQAIPAKMAEAPSVSLPIEEPVVSKPPVLPPEVAPKVEPILSEEALIQDLFKGETPKTKAPTDYRQLKTLDLLKTAFGDETGSIGKLSEKTIASREAAKELFRRLKDESGRLGETIEQTAAKAGLSPDQINILLQNKNQESTGTFEANSYVKDLATQREAARMAEAPNALDQAKGIYKQTKADLIDSLSPIEDSIATAQKKYGYEILPKYDFTNQADRSLRSYTLAGKFIEDSSLPKVIKEVDSIEALDQYLIARHAKTLEGKGVKTGRESTKDAQLVAELGPKYEPMAKEVTAYSRKLLDYSVDSGLISKDLATKLKEVYPDYVPFKRIFNELEKSTGMYGTKAVASLSKQSIVQKIKGSERAIDSPVASLLEKTYDAFAQGEKNRAARILAENSKLPGMKDLIKELPPGEKAPHTISFLDNGKKRTFETTPEIEAAAKSLDVQQLNILGKILNAPVRVAKVGITGLNAPFVGANIIRDQVTSFINSQHGLKTSVANPKVFLESFFNALKHGKLYDEMVRNAAGGTSFDLTRNQPIKTVEKLRSARSIKSRIAYTAKNPSELFRALENVFARSEELTRMQQFSGTKKSLLKSGRTAQDADILASKAARENTANFYRKGNYGKVLNGAFLYLNAGIQGSRAFIHAAERSPIKTAAKVATALYLPVVMTTLANLSDPKKKAAYEDIEDYEKENNIIYIPDNPTMNEKGQWNVIKMPLPPGISNLAIPVRRAIEQAYGLDPVGVGEMAQALIGSVSPIEPDKKKLLSTITPQAIKPTLESQTNTNFFTGKPIVPSYLKRRPKEMQSYPWTSGTAKKIGKMTDSAPIQVEQFIKGTFGGLGSQGLNLSDNILSKTGAIKESEIGGQNVLEAMAARFTKARGGRQKRLMKEKRYEK